MKLTTALFAAGVALAGVTATPLSADDGVARLLNAAVQDLDGAVRGVARGWDDDKGRARIWRVDDDDDGWDRRVRRGSDDDDDDGWDDDDDGWDDDDDDGWSGRGVRGGRDDDDDDGGDDDDD